MSKYWVLHTDGVIKNADWQEEQTGYCYPGAGVTFAEFETLAEAEAYLAANGLVVPSPVDDGIGYA